MLSFLLNNRELLMWHRSPTGETTMGGMAKRSATMLAPNVV